MGAEQSTVSTEPTGEQHTGPTSGESKADTNEKPGFFAGLLATITGGKGKQGPAIPTTSEEPAKAPAPSLVGGRRICRRNRKNKRLTRRSPMRSKSQKRQSLRNK